MTLHPITIDCVNCGAVGTMTASEDQRPGVVHVEGDDVRFCRTEAPNVTVDVDATSAVAGVAAATPALDAFEVRNPTCITSGVVEALR